jgi:hypothetical protein
MAAVLALLLTVLAYHVAVEIPTVLANGSIYISPAAIDNPSISPGSTFRVNASASNVVDVFTWQVRLEFNPQVLQCLSASVPSTSIFKLDMTPPAGIDNVVGAVELGSSRLFGVGVNGSGVLAAFEFSVVARGYSPLNFSKPLGNGTYLIDSLQRDLQLTVQDGYFDNHLPGVQCKLTIQVAGSGITNLGAGIYIYDSGFNVSVDAIPFSGWRLDHWELDTVNVGSADPYVVTMSADHVLKVVFVSIQYDLTIEVVGSGTTDPAPGSYTYEQGTIVQVDALPSSGWYLGHWELDTENVGSANPHTEVMFANHVLKAVFVRIPSVQHELTIQVAGSGATDPAAGIYSVDEGSKVSVEAVPASDWAFDHWELDGAGPLYFNPCDVTMDANHSLLAVFVQVSDVPDNAVVDVTSKTVVGAGYGMNITVTIQNQGLFTATWRSLVNVTVHCNGTAITLPDGENYAAVELGRGELATITVVWIINATDVPEGNYVLSAVVSAVPFETDLADNTLGDRWVRVSIAGDVVGPPSTGRVPDGVVNMRDVGAICNGFGTAPSEPGWNPNMDIDNDGVVSTFDVGIACSNFGKYSNWGQ